MSFGYNKEVHGRMAKLRFRHAAQTLAAAKKKARLGDCDTARAYLYSALSSMGAARVHAEAKSAILRGDDFVFVRASLDPELDRGSRLWRAVDRVDGLIRRCTGG